MAFRDQAESSSYMSQFSVAASGYPIRHMRKGVRGAKLGMHYSQQSVIAIRKFAISQASNLHRQEIRKFADSQAHDPHHIPLFFIAIRKFAVSQPLSHDFALSQIRNSQIRSPHHTTSHFRVFADSQVRCFIANSQIRRPTTHTTSRCSLSLFANSQIRSPVTRLRVSSVRPLAFRTAGLHHMVHLSRFAIRKFSVSPSSYPPDNFI